ncbi:MAG TPA: hypothetical protein G4N92_01025 [Anaerolineae bacterium]|nr:hypothetical protein [Anaerolineae bacterium]
MSSLTYAQVTLHPLGYRAASPWWSRSMPFRQAAIFLVDHGLIPFFLFAVERIQ